MDQYIGRLLDNRYEILEIIGTGGMAVVYKARCHRLNRLVAIKILKDEFARDEEFRRRFHAEGEAVAMLSHPNIVQVYDVSSTDTANFIVMELVDGISLKQYMERKGVLNWKETLHFAMQIAKGLEHAHSRGIVHRDIKPHNVMVLKNGSVKVMDFGIARVMSKSNTLTKEALGSVHYISPEQAKGGWVDNRSDLYSLSVVMYEMMTGRPPYDGESPVAVAIQHISGGAPAPSVLNPNIPGGLEQIILHGMALDTKDRYSSATEMLKDMDDFRKDPNILFAYVRPTVTDATQPFDLSAINARPKTTAERVANRRGDASATRGSDSGRLRNSDSGRVRTAGAAGGAAVTGTNRNRTGAGRNGTGSRQETDRSSQQRRRRREMEEEQNRNRITTIALVVCCAAAVLASIIFLIALFSGALFNLGADLVQVPQLVGEVYRDLEVYEDFTVVPGQPEYHENFEKGQIIHQEPSAGSQVEKGTKITVVVSLGQEPVVKYMEELRGQNIENALSFLKGQGMNPLPFDEFSDEHAEGEVIRTNPEAGTELIDGQKVEVYYSAGPVIKTAMLPNVVGLDYDTAMKRLDELGFDNVETIQKENDAPKNEVISQSIDGNVEVDVTEKIVLTVSKGPGIKKAKIPGVENIPYKDAVKKLNDAGFTNVEADYVESDAPKDQVIDQSVAEGMELDVTTTIILTVSEGPEETEPSTEAPETEPPMVTVRVTIPLPEQTEAYILRLLYEGKDVREPMRIEPGTKEITVELTGTGVRSYTLYMNDAPMADPYGTYKVDFAANG